MIIVVSFHQNKLLINALIDKQLVLIDELRIEGTKL